MEFTPEQIKEALNEVLKDAIPKFNNVLDLTFFVSKVSKQLLTTLQNESINRGDKVKATISISNTIIDELEIKGIVDLEMANEFREILTNTQSMADMLNHFGETFSEMEKIATKSWNDLWKTCLAGFGCGKAITSVDEKATKPMSALEAVMEVAKEDIDEVMKEITSDDRDEFITLSDSGKIEILEEDTHKITAVSPVSAPEAS